MSNYFLGNYWDLAPFRLSIYMRLTLIKMAYTIITLSIGTDKPEQTVDPDQMLQKVASDLGL